jgi:6-phosphogluconolactonase (cycloisomerase 2 family)
MEESVLGDVYVQTNGPDNEIIVFRRGLDGALDLFGSFSTGGKGLNEPHLTSQGSTVLTNDGRYLLVTNAASDDVSQFAVGDHAIELVRVRKTGPAPKSVAEHDGLVYVLNTSEPGLIGLRITVGGLEPVTGSDRKLPSDADPAQVGFSPDGSTLIVTERGTDSIAAFMVGSDGLLGQVQRVPSSGPTPYGFAVSTTGTLVVTEAFRAQKGAAAASSYRVQGGSVTPITPSVGSGRSEICWAVVTKDGRYAFTTNFADGAVSRFALAPDGALTLDDAVAGVTVEGRPGLRDEGLSADHRYLYAIDADAGLLVGWALGDGGVLSPIGQWGDLPRTVAGLAAR